MVINREVGGHVAYMEVHKIHVKKICQKTAREKTTEEDFYIEEMAIQQALFIPGLYNLYCVIRYTDASDHVHQDGNGMNVIFSNIAGVEAISQYLQYIKSLRY